MISKNIDFSPWGNRVTTRIDISNEHFFTQVLAKF